ncbi:hypothetical protein [Microbacterium sp. Clip185]|uniref:hypothetical protein n=1 Tax=Microbacterium sp. Clip185 TaxID=3025663 RepID=UPI0023668583|nr:hypothetical protein [Microbacterium sp. Clip185]WDG17044.1 hypothetical protein PQV94_10380 [Microbacterium sp. Clip185]
MGRLLRHRKLKPRHGGYRGRAWEPRDLDALATAVADLALGQWLHVEELLRSEEPWRVSGADYAIDGAISLLTVPAGKDPWHRDGWVFQLVSWLAAVEENDGPARIPQMDQASKGFDGLQIAVNSRSGQPKRIVVFEDKATNSPRDTVRDDVWKSFAELETGSRNPALAAEVGYLLSRIPLTDPRKTIDHLMRKQSGRAYRVSITTKAHHARAERFNGLFDGFEETVPGKRRRRRANVLEIADLRPWMDDLCDRAIAVLEGQRV